MNIGNTNKTIDPVHDLKDRVEIKTYRGPGNTLCPNVYVFDNISNAKSFLEGAAQFEPERPGDSQAWRAGLALEPSPAACAAIDAENALNPSPFEPSSRAGVTADAESGVQ